MTSQPGWIIVPCTLGWLLNHTSHSSSLKSQGEWVFRYTKTVFHPSTRRGQYNGLAQVSILNPTPSLYITALKERLPRSLYPLPTHTSLKESLYTHPTHLYTHLKERFPRSLYSTTPLPTHTSLKEQFFEGDFMFGDLPPSV